ncbi:MAG: hypothetical protein NVS9B11_17380 [Candidatus Dormibacteraceae bacterium]
MKRSQLEAAVIAGALAGVAGFAAFLVVHAIWILPIWFIAPMGLVIAALGGACVGWAYNIHRNHLPRSSWRRILAVFTAATLVLLPAEPLALTHRNLDMRDTAQTALDTSLLAGALFLASAALIGAAGGAFLGRSLRAAGVTALAAIAFAIGIGHNAPFIGTGFAAVKLWTLMLTASAVASMTLVVLESRLQKRLRSPAAASDSTAG